MLMTCWSQESEDTAAFYKDNNGPQLEISRITRDRMLTRQQIADKKNNIRGKWTTEGEKSEKYEEIHNEIEDW